MEKLNNSQPINNEIEHKLSGEMRTHYCGDLRPHDVGTRVTLCGWVNKNRNLGGLRFIDLRDKFGLTQLAFDEYQGDTDPDKISLEAVIKVVGVVRSRPESALNKNMKTGEVEVSVSTIEILSMASEPPFLPHGKVGAHEDLRLKYRYLDLRRYELQNILKERSESMRTIRNVLYNYGFTEVETPILYKTTPEGARDYLVPSRVHKGSFYALPQSPQTLKQLLMISSLDKYFQICKCFRDEDLRSDRQPEFSQVDIEVSFAGQDYIKSLVTEILKSLFQLEDDFKIPVMSYEQAMNDYGSDKPDIRFGLKHSNITELISSLEIPFLTEYQGDDFMAKSLFLSSKDGELKRKDLDTIQKYFKEKNAVFTWVKIADGQRSGGIAKFVDDATWEKLTKINTDINESGFVFIVASAKSSLTHQMADYLRRDLATKFELHSNTYEFLWVNDFPLLEYDENSKRYMACHHPFTAPKNTDDMFSDDQSKIGEIVADAYDLVCNGYEMAGGSVRIHDQKVQKRMFELLGLSDEEVSQKFGFFTEALQYGTPPHAGVAFGLDRTVMLKVGTENIRDVIAFPKTNQAYDLMSQCPSPAEVAQLEDLALKVVKKD